MIGVQICIVDTMLSGNCATTAANCAAPPPGMCTCRAASHGRPGACSLLRKPSSADRGTIFFQHYSGSLTKRNCLGSYTQSTIRPQGVAALQPKIADCVPQGLTAARTRSSHGLTRMLDLYLYRPEPLLLFEPALQCERQRSAVAAVELVPEALCNDEGR